MLTVQRQGRGEEKEEEKGGPRIGIYSARNLHIKSPALFDLVKS